MAWPSINRGCTNTSSISANNRFMGGANVSPPVNRAVRAIMIPAGYMAKHISARPDWLKAEHVTDVYSVSNCVSKDFADYINYWKHNGYWLFDSPEVIAEVARENVIDLADTRLFYYELYEFEYNDDNQSWERFVPEASFKTHVVEPMTKQFEGYDVVSFYAHTSPECSPLSCNSFASEIKTNAHCLLELFEVAKQIVESNKFKDGEPGPYRIFAVYSVQWP